MAHTFQYCGVTFIHDSDADRGVGDVELRFDPILQQPPVKVPSVALLAFVAELKRQAFIAAYQRSPYQEVLDMPSPPTINGVPIRFPPTPKE